MQVPLIRLQCGVNSYEWGKKGHDSAAAKFALATPASGFDIEASKPYAELWMGTHPSNPSKDHATGRTLLELVEDNQALLSSTIAAKYGKKLPFLFKVLSINKALSIQAHPNKKLAEQLHARDPRNYPDDNHKPEMTIAITPFEGLCGFRPIAEVAEAAKVLAPLRKLVGDDACDDFVKAVTSTYDIPAQKTALKTLFAKTMSAPQDALIEGTELLNQLALAELNGGSSLFDAEAAPTISTSTKTFSELITRLYGQFKNDIGLFMLFFLNYVTLDPGEAMFLRADDIHAYVSGDVVECMAASDNVVRAGFTPKFKDVDTLVSMLTYDFAPIDEQKMTPAEYPYATLNRAAYSSGSSMLLYDPPIEEFAVVRTVLKGNSSKATFEPLDGPSIVICTSGKGKISVGPTVQEMKQGYVYFVGSTAELVLESEGGEDDEFTTFKAFCEIESQPANGTS